MRDSAARLVRGLDAEVLLIEVPEAELAKTGTTLQRCWDALAAAGFTRTDAIVGLGGGATTDLAGFVAATWLRGQIAALRAELAKEAGAGKDKD